MESAYPGMTACLTDGGTGTIVDVLVDTQTGEERHIVLGVDGYLGPLRVAPSSAVWRVDEQVHLELTCHEAATLPLFDPAAYGPEVGLKRRMHTTGGRGSARSGTAR